MNEQKEITNFLLYQTPDGQTRLEVRLQDETVWLSLTDMSDLFQRDKSVISRHIRNIFAENRKYFGQRFHTERRVPQTQRWQLFRRIACPQP